jgi:hypothetical protein
MPHRKEYHICKGCIPLFHEMLEDISWKMEKELPNIMYRKFIKESEGKLKAKLKGNFTEKMRLIYRGV